MVTFEEIKPGIKLKGLRPGQSVTVVGVTRHGNQAVQVVYRWADGQTDEELIYPNQLAELELETEQTNWVFTAEGDAFRLATEAYRIHLAYLFDPVLAVHTSLIEPLPHQITAVYEDMLPRQPLRFLLADDPGAGKTIMAGLLIKELIVRGDVRRCLICAPGSLSPQWQDELWRKFQLRFTVLTRDMVETSVTGNPFQEEPFLIIRLDQVARDEGLKAKLQRTEWDLVIVDEAHKMSAHFWANELEETKRYKLGKLLRDITRHLLLMTATPHNGKEEDFQLFLALLDPDRFEGKFRMGTHQPDISDIMRRRVKEDLRQFDGRPLFPERRAYTVDYPLSAAERRLYESVTDYVQTEFNRADKLNDTRRRGTVGFALTILQRRLASSPAAIYHSLARRRKRLQDRLAEIKQQQTLSAEADYDPAYLDTLEEDAPAAEAEHVAEEILDSATAALTMAELEAEIETLQGLELAAQTMLHRGDDRKWEQLATIIQDEKWMVDQHGKRRKLVIFTEHRDTLTYLIQKISTLFGQESVWVRIDGTVPREQRRAVEAQFRNNPDVYFLLATDAAGEGINLQRAHLMVNYDLPWNPNRLEQRFGRIHRIGQTEVCHLWNLVSTETREGQVYERVLRKLETESKALQGQVFDIMGKLFEEEPLRNLLIEAVRYSDRPEVRAKLNQKIDNTMAQERTRELLQKRSLARNSMDTSKIEAVRHEMERYMARRLQPHYIQSFFMTAFADLGGALSEREAGRYQIQFVPARIRNHHAPGGAPVPILQKYERVCFEKSLIEQPGYPLAEFLCPGHPLLDAVIALTLHKYERLLQIGTVLVDKNDPGTALRVLFLLKNTVYDGRMTADDRRRVISTEVQFLTINQEGTVAQAGYAPHKDYRAITAAERAVLADELAAPWLQAEQLENKVIGYAVSQLVPDHKERIRARREALLDKTLAAVHDRLTKEIHHWDARATEFRVAAKRNKPNARLNAEQAQRRADDLAERLRQRKAELAAARKISVTPPAIIGGAVVVPLGLLLHLQQKPVPPELLQRQITENIAMHAVMQAEIGRNNFPTDVSHENRGYDIESLDPESGRLRFIEVKGRRIGAETISVTYNEIMCALNTPENYLLAIVLVEPDGQAHPPRYIPRPFETAPDKDASSVNYRLSALLAKAHP